jgi:hypothetical protein
MVEETVWLFKPQMQLLSRFVWGSAVIPVGNMLIFLNSGDCKESSVKFVGKLLNFGCFLEKPYEGVLHRVRIPPSAFVRMVALVQANLNGLYPLSGLVGSSPGVVLSYALNQRRQHVEKVPKTTKAAEA